MITIFALLQEGGMPVKDMEQHDCPQALEARPGVPSSPSSRHASPPQSPFSGCLTWSEANIVEARGQSCSGVLDVYRGLQVVEGFVPAPVGQHCIGKNQKSICEYYDVRTMSILHRLGLCLRGAWGTPSFLWELRHTSIIDCIHSFILHSGVVDFAPIWLKHQVPCWDAVSPPNLNLYI